MAYDPDKHHRRSIRLPQYDYSQAGVYFVTICTHERECVLGDVVNGVVVLNDWGIIADRFWAEVSAHFHGVAVDAYIIMPNHAHANIVIVNHPIRRGEVPSPALPTTPNTRRGEVPSPAPPTTRNTRRGEVPSPALPTLPTTPEMAILRAKESGGGTPPLQPTLGQIIAYYKYQTTKAINLMRGMPGAKFWQRNYWEHVIRNEAEMNRILEYIETNPARWDDDQLHPAAQPNRFNRG